MVSFNASHKVVLDQMLLDVPGVRPGKMFGYPAYYAEKKLSICIIEDSVGFKLPASRVSELMSSNPKITHFQPMGRRKMREWVQVNVEDSNDLFEYTEVFEESIEYVLAVQAGR